MISLANENQTTAQKRQNMAMKVVISKPAIFNGCHIRQQWDFIDINMTCLLLFIVRFWVHFMQYSLQPREN